MGPKKVSRASSPSKKKARNTIELKKEIIEKYESGFKIAEIGRMYGKSPSTISSIVAKKEAIKKANVAKGVNVLTKQRSQTIEDVEQLLLIWINQKQLDGDSISEAIICEKARLLYADLIKKMPGTSASVLSDFKASRGWFEKFKRRTGIHSVTRYSIGASSDNSGAEKFVSEFKDYVEAKGFIPQQVFNCDETGLFWKKMPKRTFITQEAWKKLWPGCVHERDFEGFEPPPDDPTHVVQSFVDLGKSVGLEVSGEDVEELVDDRSEEKLTTEELQDLHLELHQTADEEVASDEEEETGENVPSSEIKDIISMWSKVQRFVEKNHPDKAVAGCVCNLFNDNVLPHFRQILKRRQKQTSLDSFLVRHGSTDSEAGPSAKRPRREVTPDSYLIPKVLMEGHSPSKQ
ncbi:tigger transposable element-derived protein 1-like [Saccopteryx bilineata]|uniref:tigger transposable element-derived protein 1-like n=1 Tax=Saccopteryx bilineata TaxID=59482 RepID=UPI00338E02E7